jgi:hypothetical protein
MRWFRSTLALVEFTTGRLVFTTDLGHAARITFNGAATMGDTQTLTTTQLDAELEPAEPRMLERVGGRKFVMAVLTLGAATTLRCFDLIDAEHWLLLAGSVMAAYGGINVVQKAIEAKAK